MSTAKTLVERLRAYATDRLREYIVLDDKHFPSAAPYEWKD